MIPDQPLSQGYSYHLRVVRVFSGSTVYYTDTAQPETVALWVEEMLEGTILAGVHLASDEWGSFVRVYFWTPTPLFLTHEQHSVLQRGVSDDDKERRSDDVAS